MVVVPSRGGDSIQKAREFPPKWLRTSAPMTFQMLSRETLRLNITTL